MKRDNGARWPYTAKIDAITTVFGLLAVICIFGFDISSYHKAWHLASAFQAGMFFFIGLGLLYRGVRKVWQAKAEQEQIYWYKQPGILLSISLLLAIPEDMLLSLLSSSTLNASLSASIPLQVGYWILFALPFTFLIAAGYFWLKGRRRKAVGGK